MICAGIGCRKQCDPGDVLAALRGALLDAALDASALVALCTSELKAGEPALELAAHALQRPLHFLTQAQLAIEPTLTHSTHALEHTGLSSLSEAAALAGVRVLSGKAGRLLGPRTVSGGATCALARLEDES